MAEVPVADQLQQAIEAGLLPGWVGQASPEESRQGIRSKYKGSKDIAGAAEALIEEGSIVYDQATPENIVKMLQKADLPETNQVGILSHYYGGAPLDDALTTTRANCYEFVHLSALMAHDEGARPKIGNTIRSVIDPDSLQEWDFKSPIPRGKVIIGCAPNMLGGQGTDGTYHFGISLGDGKVANNRGKGAKTEPLDDVFGGWLSVYRLPGGRVVYGDYACYKPKEEPEPEEETAYIMAAPRGETVPNPRSAKQMRGIGLGVFGCLVLPILVGCCIVIIAISLFFIPRRDQGQDNTVAESITLESVSPTQESVSTTDVPPTDASPTDIPLTATPTEIPATATIEPIFIEDDPFGDTVGCSDNTPLPDETIDILNVEILDMPYTGADGILHPLTVLVTMNADPAAAILNSYSYSVLMYFDILDENFSGAMLYESHSGEDYIGILDEEWIDVLPGSGEFVQAEGNQILFSPPPGVDQIYIAATHLPTSDGLVACDFFPNDDSALILP